MAKRNGFNPFILLETPSPTPTDATVIGGGTGQGGVTVNAYPMSFESWLGSEWKDDYITDNEINFNDYVVWWEFCEFSRTDWELYNGDTWDEYFG